MSIWEYLSDTYIQRTCVESVKQNPEASSIFTQSCKTLTSRSHLEASQVEAAPLEEQLLQFSHQRFPSLSADTGSIDPCGHMTAVLTYRPVVLSRGVISLCQSAVKRLKDKKKNT